MTRTSRLNLRNILIAVHDLLASTAALLFAFSLRFEGGEEFAVRLPLLQQIPAWVFDSERGNVPHFQIDQNKVAYCLPARRAEYHARLHGVSDYAAHTRLCLRRSKRPGSFFFGKTTIILYSFLEVLFPSATIRLPLLPI